MHQPDRSSDDCFIRGRQGRCATHRLRSEPKRKTEYNLFAELYFALSIEWMRKSEFPSFSVLIPANSQTWRLSFVVPFSKFVRGTSSSPNIDLQQAYDRPAEDFVRSPRVQTLTCDAAMHSAEQLLQLRSDIV